MLINDVQQLIDAKAVNKKNMKPMSLDTFDYTKYHPIDEVRREFSLNNLFAVFTVKYEKVHSLSFK